MTQRIVLLQSDSPDLLPDSEREDSRDKTRNAAFANCVVVNRGPVLAGGYTVLLTFTRSCPCMAYPSIRQEACFDFSRRYIFEFVVLDDVDGPRAFDTEISHLQRLSHVWRPLIRLNGDRTTEDHAMELGSAPRREV